MLIRGPVAALVFGTACSQDRWQDPPITSRSPWACGSRSETPPPRGRMLNIRVAPRLTMATMVSSVLLRPMAAELSAARTDGHNGSLNVCAWIESGLGYAVAGPVPDKQLDRLADIIRASARSPS